MAADGMLKLVLPDTELVPTLTSEQASCIPNQLLERLFAIGDVQDFGDLTILTVKPSSQLNYSLVRRSMLWIVHGASAQFLEHGEVQVLSGGASPVQYVPAVHDDDLDCTATADTHRFFCTRLELYIFAARFAFLDLKAHVSDEICSSRYPVYEAEIVSLLNELTTANLIHDLQITDPGLSQFIGKRLQCMQGMLAANNTILPMLRGCVSARERLISVVRRADSYIVDAGVQAICSSIENSLEATAVLEALIEKHRSAEPVASAAARRSVATTHSSGGAHDGNDEDEEDDIPLRTRSFARGAHSAPNTNPPTPASLATAPSKQPRTRRARPSSTDFDYSHPHHMGLNHITPTRPTARNEYWSVTQERWNQFSANRQKIFTHAALMCETDLGVSQPDAERCATCKKRGVACHRYLEEGVTAHATGKCAYCLIKAVLCDADD